MPATPPPAIVQQIDGNEAARMCAEAESNGRLLHVVEITRTDRDGNTYRQFYQENSAQAVHRCVKDMMDGYGEYGPTPCSLADRSSLSGVCSPRKASQ